jgi:preprotein translocase subunit SecD
MRRAFLAALFVLAASSAGADTRVVVEMTDQGGPPMAQAVETLRQEVQRYVGVQPKMTALPRRQVQIDVAGDAAFEKLQTLFKPPENLNLRLVPLNVTPEDVRAGRAGLDVELLKFAYGPEQWLPVYRRHLSFGRVTDATPALDERSGMPMVAIRLDEHGTQAFGQITTENTGRRIAIVLGSDVLIAPVVASPIRGGRVQIQGSLSQQQALELAIRIRAASIPPGPFKLVELHKIKPVQ